MYDFETCAAVQSSTTLTDAQKAGYCSEWSEASSTNLASSAIGDLSSALYNVLEIVIPVAVAVGIFFFAYAWVRGVFRNRR